jgi:hypothetical protein
MSKSITICPHCGKQVSNPDKLAWHLSRECPVFSSSAPIDTHAKDVPDTNR